MDQHTGLAADVEAGKKTVEIGKKKNYNERKKNDMRLKYKVGKYHPEYRAHYCKTLNDETISHHIDLTLLENYSDKAEKNKELEGKTITVSSLIPFISIANDVKVEDEE